MQNVAVNREARAVAGTVPTRFRRVPRDDATEVRATRRDGVHLAPRVPVDGPLVAGAPHDPPLPGRDVCHVARAAEAVAYEMRGLLRALREGLLRRQ